MLDLNDPEILTAVTDAVNVNFIPYKTLLSVTDKVTLQKQRFFETTEEYIDLVKEFEQNAEEEEKILRICIAIRILVHLGSVSSVERKRHYEKFSDFFRVAMRSVNGSLYTLFRKVENQLGVIEPVQAPRGWSCSICLASGNSHLCLKTECGHYFHIGCAGNFTSPTCPLCRQIM